ncbi:putative malonyl-CoA-acyl carrier protein transacylase, mitochondrial [Hypsibius exemplaris]|uniref:[acyl-carrier-protein] S-malonyltransferase n=1 Tax=Hypsibius exemplaris TaxID=2072580 RepID=A0A9X6N9J6_HYPEX|nr:putative malonyl-CoA-acyl carrier protein transacylase, mitochondrial [Hypsibius exemplaris]
MIFSQLLQRSLSFSNASASASKRRYASAFLTTGIHIKSNRHHFSTSALTAARGNRARPSYLNKESSLDELNPVVDDFPDMKHRKSTPELVRRFQQENPQLQQLLDNSDRLTQDDNSPTPSSAAQPEQPFHRERDQAKKVPRPKIDSKRTSVILFPGQGSQFVGMGAKLLEYPNVREIYDVAGEILGYNLLNMCLNGPVEELNKTVFCQTAIFVTSVAALEKLKADHPGAVESCIAAAGFSVGEYAALVFAGSLSFESGVKLVKARAEAMQAASEAVSSGMLSVMVDHNSELNKAMELARLWCIDKKKIADPVCKIANYLFPEVKVVAGNTEALDFLEANAALFRIKPMKRLAVSGAFHTPLMRDAREEFAGHVSRVNFKQPTIKIHSNVSGSAYHGVHSIPKILIRQVDSPVKWEQTLHILYERPQGSDFPRTYEVGPGRQLGAILKRNNAKAHAAYTAIDV